MITPERKQKSFFIRRSGFLKTNKFDTFYNFFVNLLFKQYKRIYWCCLPERVHEKT
jgi:hypothetical protein